VELALLGLWLVVNAAAYVVIVVVGVGLEQFVSGSLDLGGKRKVPEIVTIAVIGAAFQGFILGRWQWQILTVRMPGLQRRR
jgi:hypothetical protein